MHVWGVFGAKNLAANSVAPSIPAWVAKATATTIRAFVAKNLAAKTIAPPIPLWVAKASATTIRAFVAKNLAANSVAPSIPAWVAKNLASDSYRLLRFFINPSATHDFIKINLGLGIKIRKSGKSEPRPSILLAIEPFFIQIRYKNTRFV